MTLGIGLDLQGKVKVLVAFFLGYISSWLARQEGIRAVFGSRKIQSSSPFWCHKNQQVCSSSE